MKHLALFPWKDKSKKNNVSSAAIFVERCRVNYYRKLYVAQCIKRAGLPLCNLTKYKEDADIIYFRTKETGLQLLP